MVELWKTVVKKILEIIPVICIALLSLSIVMLVVSLDPEVKWNEYNQEIFSVIYGHYFSTLWSSFDLAAFVGQKDRQHPCKGKYMDILKPLHDGKVIFTDLMLIDIQNSSHFILYRVNILILV